MIREIARYDVGRYEQISAWPLAEALLAFEARVIERAQQSHWQNTLSWQIGGGKKPPKRPAVIEED